MPWRFPLLVTGCILLCWAGEATAGKPQPTPRLPDPVRRVLQTTLIPRVELRDIPVREALDLVIADLRSLNPNAEAITVEIRLKPLVDPETSLAAAARIPANLPPAPSQEYVKITMALSFISAMEAFRYIAGLADLKVCPVENGVAIIPNSDPNPSPMFTRDFHLPREFAVTRPKLMAALKKDCQKFLHERVGPMTDGAAAILNDEGTRLTVHNTEEALDELEDRLQDRLWTEEPPVPGPNVKKVNVDDPSEDLRQKMKSIILPSVKFEGVPLRDAVAQLRELSVRHDPEGPRGSGGMRIVFDDGNQWGLPPDVVPLAPPPPETVTDTASVPGLDLVVFPNQLQLAPPVPPPDPPSPADLSPRTPASPAVNEEEPDPAGGLELNPTITYSAKKVSLYDAVMAVALLAQYHVRVESYEAVFTTKADNLLFRRYLVPPNLAEQARALHKARTPGIFGAGSTNWSRPEVFYNERQRMMEVFANESGHQELRRMIEKGWSDYYAAQKAKKAKP